MKSCNATPIDPILFPMMPDPYDHNSENGYYYFEQLQMKGYIQTNPRPVHTDGYLYFPYALIIFDADENHILSSTIEQTDYRILSDLTRIPKKELMGSNKGYLSSPSLAIYHSQGHEIIEPIEENFTKEEAIEALIDIACDALGMSQSPLFVGTNGTSH